MKILKKAENFYKNKILKKKGIFFTPLRVFITSVLNFINNKGFDKASTLTYYSLLSIIPLFAIAFGIAQALYIDALLNEQVKKYFSDQPVVAEKLINFSESTLKTTKGGLIASFGIIILFWTILSMIGNVSGFFNEIWEAKDRTLFQKIKSFTPVILVFPLLLVGPSSIIAFSLNITKNIPLFGILFKTLMIFASYIINWLILSFIYIYLPNAKVSWKASFIAAFITGIIFLIWQWIYVTFQVKAGSYGAIYGGFSALPLFLIWLNYSWIILIFGARMSREIQRELQSS